MTIDTSKYTEKHGKVPDKSRWIFTLYRGVSRCHRYFEMIDYSRAERMVISQAKREGYTRIILEP